MQTTTSRTEPSTAKGCRTQQAILEMTRELFLAQGFHGTTMRQVAAAGGVTLGAVYNHFSSKDELFKRVFDEYSPLRIVVPALAEAQGETAEDLLRDAAVCMNRMLKERNADLRLIFIELVEFGGRNIPPIIDRNGQAVSDFYTRLQQAPGKLKPISPLLMMRSFMGLMSSWFMAEALFGQEKLPEGLAELKIEDAVDIFLHGVLDTEEKNT
ncbi:MAG: TetR/AcrR family transcriptional regulator [Deltaproteobacteria bacterium]|nr:TetR/AcrR family transcriptional regulator [Deltaproteobacteria bacterium]